jgi:hypothetical protein
MNKRKRPVGEKAELSVQVAFDSGVVDKILSELAKTPTVEEGGKYIGHILAPGDPRQRQLGLDDRQLSLVITDFLPSGPNAIRTAVELQPDGPYQEQLFRRVEMLDSDVEHLGTWHSHHCNGLQTLSQGDIEGYFRTVNKRAYRPDFFVASLVKRIPRGTHDDGWIDHFLFCRGADAYYRITDLISVVNSPSSFGTVIDHGLGAGHVSQGIRSHQSAIPSDAAGPSDDHRTSGPWYVTPSGKSVLASDKRLLSTRFPERLVATRKGDAITITAHSGNVTLAATYPSQSDSEGITVSVAAGNVGLLQVKAELSHRELAFAAGIAAIDALRLNADAPWLRPS